MGRPRHWQRSRLYPGVTPGNLGVVDVGTAWSFLDGEREIWSSLRMWSGLNRSLESRDGRVGGRMCIADVMGLGGSVVGDECLCVILKRRRFGMDSMKKIINFFFEDLIMFRM